MLTTKSSSKCKHFQVQKEIFSKSNPNRFHLLLDLNKLFLFSTDNRVTILHLFLIKAYLSKVTEWLKVGKV